MADMYGTIRSNWFKVRDPDAFEAWFKEFCYFGGEVELWREDDTFAFGGHEMYPSAWPRNTDDEQSEWALGEFARIFCALLAPGEELRVLAVGNEKLRCTAAQHLVVRSPDDYHFTNLYEGN